MLCVEQQQERQITKAPHTKTKRKYKIHPQNKQQNKKHNPLSTTATTNEVSLIFVFNN